MKISADLTNEEVEAFNQYKEKNGFESSYKAIKNWIKEIRFNQEKIEEVKEVVIIKSEYEKLLNELKD